MSVLSHGVGFAAFSHAKRNWLKKSCIFHSIKHTTGWESNGRKPPILWESLETNFQAVPTGCILLCFPMLWDIDGKPRVFSMWWSIPWDKNLMEKKHPHFGKSMGTNFLGSSHKMGFVFFSSGIGYWWEDLCIFHMMKHTVG